MARPSTRRSRANALALMVAAGSLLTFALAACTSAPVTDSTSSPTSSPSSSSTPSATATPEPAPSLKPAGDAAANLPYFDSVNRALLAATPTPNGQQIVENLVAAGFAKADMEITPDDTVGKEAAGSIQFSIRINGSCLLGQTGEAGYNAVAGPLLGTGKCLVGKTRAIDF